MTTTDPTRRGGYPAADGTAADVPPAPRGPAPGAERAADPSTAPQPATPGETLDLDAVEAELRAALFRPGVWMKWVPALVREVRRLSGDLVETGDRLRETLAKRDELRERLQLAEAECERLRAGPSLWEQDQTQRRTEAAILRWAAERLREPGAPVYNEPAAAALFRWADELGAAGPDVYRLPAEPPTEVTELWDRGGDLHTRNPDFVATWVDASRWLRGWGTLLYERGPLSTTPPAGTEGKL